jgi:hypothetical protein
MFLNGQNDIFTAGADGTDLVQVTNTPEDEDAPDWVRIKIDTVVIDTRSWRPYRAIPKPSEAPSRSLTTAGRIDRYR